MNSIMNTYDLLVMKLLRYIVCDINVKRRMYTVLCAEFSIILVENETFRTFQLLYGIHGEKPHLSCKHKFTLRITIFDTWIRHHSWLIGTFNWSYYHVYELWKIKPFALGEWTWINTNERVVYINMCCMLFSAWSCACL